MKIPTAKKIPSGNWRVQLMVSGNRISVTAPTKKEAEKEAAALKSGVKKAKENIPFTLNVAFNKYIDAKSVVLSPATIAGYRRIQKNLLPPLSDERIDALTREKVQKWVNGLMQNGKKPKTIYNAHGLLNAVLAEYRPDFTLRTTLPQKEKIEIKIPSEAEIVDIFATCKGTKYELPILLAVWLGLRASEIRGLKWEDIDGDRIYIRRAIVEGENGSVEKGTKTYSGTRVLHLPKYLRDLIAAQDKTISYLVPMSGHAMYNGFGRICEKAGLPHFRFHDLRHMNASVMLAEGIPDKYSMKRMGHATNNMLKTTYQHTIKEKEQEYDTVIDACFEKLFDV